MTAALALLRRLGRVVRPSRIYETAPVGYLNQGPFLNMVVEIRTTRAPAGVLAGAKAVERAVGRRTGGPRFGPRLLDVDLLLYSDQQIALPGLTVPHPRLHRRAFVLAPLADLAPGLVHPTLGVTVAELLGVLPTEGVRPVTPLTPNMCSW